MSFAIQHPRDYTAPQRVLITGGSGFLGSHLARRLGDRGMEVHAVSRSEHISASDYLRWWKGDMADFVQVRSILYEVKPDVVFHLSGLGTASRDCDLVLPTLQSLLISTVNILMIAKEISCARVVLAGSLQEPDPTSSEMTPRSPYAAAKWASAAYSRMFHDLYAVPTVVLRIFMTYGPGQNESKLIPYVILSLLKGIAPKVSSGQHLYDWVYVDDVIDGFLMAAQAPNVEGCTIDIGSGALVPIRAVVDQLVALTGSEVQPLFGALPDRPLEPVHAASLHDAYAKLGWKPRTPLSEGLKQTVRWYKTRLMRTVGETAT
jgi:nucleoside-diphosphate-sugar epimerase